ncbi:MAG: AAA family ATPase [Actinobacteria bacterium]|nr:AAA family ATPase [Actinomycetota bacterium]
MDQSAQAPSDFVGRERDLAELSSRLDDAFGGRGRLVLLSGEAGIGKSRLAEECGRIASDRGAQVLWGACWEGEGAPAFWPWIQIIRALLADRGFTLARDLGVALSDVAMMVPDLRMQMPVVAAEPPSDPEQARFRMFDAVSTVLRVAGAKRPLMLVLDDLHWADRSSLLLLRFLSAELRTAHVFVLGTYRDVDVGPAHDLTGMLADLTRERIALTGLDANEVTKLMTETAGAVPEEKLTAVVVERTAGNPFFVKEVSRLLQSQKQMGSTAGLTVPQGVKEVLERRFARLSQHANELLGVAAVLGGSFDVDLVARVRDVDRDRALELLDEATQARLVSPLPDSPRRYQFAHALVREALYEGLGTSHRAALHRLAGEAIEKMFESNLDPHLTALAHHFFNAVAEDTGGKKAVTYSVRAGARALKLLAYDEAAQHFARAVTGMSATGDDDLGPVMLSLADALTKAGDLPQARKTYEDVVELAVRRNRPEELAHAALGLGTGLGGFEVAMFDDRQIALLEAALGALPAADSALRAWLLARLSVATSFRAPLDARVSLSTQAVEMARRVGDSAALAHALGSFCDAMSGPDYVEARLQAATEMISLTDSPTSIHGECTIVSCPICLCDPEMLLLGRRHRIEALLELGDVGAFDAEVDLYERSAENLRQPLYQWYVPLFRGMRALMAGHIDEARRHATDAEAVGARAHSHNAQLLIGTLRLSIAATADHPEDAQRLWDEMLSELPDIVNWPSLSAPTTWLRALSGDAVNARAELQRLAASDFSELPKDAEWLSSMIYLAEACALVGESGDTAASLYAQLRPYEDLMAVDGIAAAFFGSAARHLGVLAGLLHRWDDAAKHFDHAMKRHSDAGAAVLTAHTKRDRATVLLSRGDASDVDTAEALLTDAVETYRSLGLTWHAKAAEALLPNVRSAEPNTFVRDGEFWTLGYAGETVRLKDSKGLRDIALLLGSPHKEIHAGDLVASSDGAFGAVRAGVDHGELEARRPGGTGPVLDEQARAAYRARIGDLQEEIDEAEAFNDAGRSARAREELDALTHELSLAYGLGGRARATGDPGERARKAVTERIRDTLKRVDSAHPALARHLRSAIRTGTFCSYAPESPVLWIL